MSESGDYIPREAAIAAVDNVYFPRNKRKLEEIPAADVRPVVKARWVYTDMSRLACSNCGNPVAFALKDDGWHHGDFCPNCGADMREEE